MAGTGFEDFPSNLNGSYASFIETTAVPIPAAAWLFGSALRLLGWMRRKQA
ncbi:MAG: hypothetical protein ACR2QB_04370 [Gammaproteobacteria bacterium]